MSQPVVNAGRVWCHDEHRDLSSLYVKDSGPKAFDTFGSWLFHRVFAHGRATWECWWKEEIARIGFVDTIPWGDPPRHEGGEMFWRWDFWNSGHGKEWREVIARENASRTRAQRLKEQHGRR